MPPEPTAISIMLVDDHQLVAEGLAAMLNATSDLRGVGTAASGAQAISLAEQCRPDVVVMDSHLPDGAGAEVAA